MAEENSFWLASAAKPIFFFLALLTAAGVFMAFQMPISVFPDTNFPRVVIGVDNGVMPVEQMQVTITKPIEDAINSVPGLLTVRSTTSRGSAEVSLFFDWNVDMFRTLQLTDAALSKISQSLPATARITTNRLTFATFPILGYALTADETVPQTRLWEIATYDLKPPLNRVDGVNTVTVQGGQVPEFHIVPNLSRLQAAGVTLLEMVNAVQESNIIDSPGLYEANHRLVLGLIGAQAHSAAELSNLVVKTSPGGVAIRVADVATVEPSTMPVYTAVRSNGKPAVLINITRQPSSNTVAVANAVAAEIGRLQSRLPPGAHLQPFYDQSELVRDSIKSVRDAILIGLVLACIILFLFLHDWRSSLVAGLVIPVTVAVTILFLRITGQSFNLMTLGGLAAAIGLVIDDAIVVVENIAIHRQAGEPAVGAVRKAIREIGRPLFFSTLTPVIVFLPLISVTQVTGSFFRALAVTMTVALLTSLLLALTFTPALSILLQGKAHAAPEKPPGWFAKSHAWALSLSLERPLVPLAVCGLLILGGYFCYRGLGSDLLPEMDEGAFILDYFTPAGSSLTETNRILGHVDRILRRIPEVSITSRRTGLELGLAAVTEANRGDFTVRLKSDRSRGIDEVIADARQQIHAAEPSLDMEFTPGPAGHDRRSFQLTRADPDQAVLERPEPAAGVGAAGGGGDRENPRRGGYGERGG